MSRIVREAQPTDMADIMTVMVYSAASTASPSLWTRPKRIYVAHAPLAKLLRRTIIR